jgi:hypothetical protein
MLEFCVVQSYRSAGNRQPLLPFVSAEDWRCGSFGAVTCTGSSRILALATGAPRIRLPLPPGSFIDEVPPLTIHHCVAIRLDPPVARPQDILFDPRPPHRHQHTATALPLLIPQCGHRLQCGEEPTLSRDVPSRHDCEVPGSKPGGPDAKWP